MAKIKYQVSESKFIEVDYSNEKEKNVIMELNRDMERIKSKERRVKVKSVSLDSLLDEYGLEFKSEYPDSLEKILQDEKIKVIKESMEKLTKIQQKVIMDYFWENKTLRQISRERNVHISTVSETYHAGLSKLKNILKYFTD